MKKYLVYIISIIVFCSFTSYSQSSDEFSFVFMTDIHLKDNSKTKHSFEKAIGKINSLKPDFVITGGDLVFDAQGVSYDKADGLFSLYKSMFGELKMPVYNTLGNHDLFAVSKKSNVPVSNAFYGKKLYEKYFGKTFYSFSFKNWHFIILDPFVMSSQGRGYGVKISKDELDWLKQDLKPLNSKQPICIVSHIPFRLFATQNTKDTGSSKAPKDIVSNTTELLKYFANYNLKLALQGHAHIFGAYTDSQNIKYIIGGAICGTWWNGPCLNAPRGFLFVTVKGENVKYEYMGYE